MLFMKKQCNICKVFKPVDKFYRDKTGKYGVGYRCKVCDKSYIRMVRKRPGQAKRRKEISAIWRKTEKARKYRRAYENQRYRTDLAFRLSRIMGTAIRESLQGKKAGRKWLSLIGYTIGDLKCHIEKQFKLGMTWENYGLWHIDHIVPVSAFDFTESNDIGFKMCWKLENLQPLWAMENFMKSNKVLGSSLCESKRTG